MRLSMVLVSIAALVWLLGAAGPAAAQCEPAGDIEFVCGPVTPEDLVAVPGDPLDRGFEHGERGAPVPGQQRGSLVRGALPERDGPTAARHRDVRHLSRPLDRGIPTARSEPPPRGRRCPHTLRRAAWRSGIGRGLRARCEWCDTVDHLDRLCGGPRQRRWQLGRRAGRRRVRPDELQSARRSVRGGQPDVWGDHW